MAREVTGGLALDLIIIRAHTKMAGKYQMEEMAVRAYLDHARCWRNGLNRRASSERPVPRDPAPTMFVSVRYSSCWFSGN